MPAPQNFYAFLGASVVGFVCAATVFVVQQYQQEKRRHVIAKDLERLNREVTMVRAELNELLISKSSSQIQNGILIDRTNRRSGGGSRRKQQGGSERSQSVAAASTASSTADDFQSANEIDSSDLEFYDVSEDDDQDESDAIRTGKKSVFSAAPFLNLQLNEIDRQLEEAARTTINPSIRENMIEDCLKQLEELRMRRTSLDDSDAARILWRIGKAHARLGKLIAKIDPEREFDNYTRGLEACAQVTERVADQSADVHKWLAILHGYHATNLSPLEKVREAIQMYDHLQRAVALRPDESLLHHMIGEFKYQFADLKWYEKKLVGTIFAEASAFTYADALDACLQAEIVATGRTTHSKGNKLLIAKCKIRLREYDEAVKWLDEADAIQDEDDEDEDVNEQIAELLKKYKTY